MSDTSIITSGSPSPSRVDTVRTGARSVRPRQIFLGAAPPDGSSAPSLPVGPAPPAVDRCPQDPVREGLAPRPWARGPPAPIPPSTRPLVPPRALGVSVVHTPSPVPAQEPVRVLRVGLRVARGRIPPRVRGPLPRRPSAGVVAAPDDPEVVRSGSPSVELVALLPPVGGPIDVAPARDTRDTTGPAFRSLGRTSLPVAPLQEGQGQFRA